MEGISCQLGVKVASLSKRINICILVTVAFLALLFSFSSGPDARAQLNDASSNFTTMNASTLTSSTVTTSSSLSYSSLDPTTNGTSSTFETGVATTSTSTGVASSVTSSTSSDSGWSTVAMTTTATAAATSETTTSTSTSSSVDYSISFSPTYWLCTPISVTFAGPLVESGFYGDTLQFQYFQYNPSYPSVLNPIFTDSGLTVTSDTVNYWIGYGEYAPVNFAYQPDLAVKVVDVTPKSNGYAPGLLFMQLTNVSPGSGSYCAYDPSMPTPEFQAQWLMIIASMMLGLVFLRVHKHYRPSE